MEGRVAWEPMITGVWANKFLFKASKPCQAGCSRSPCLSQNLQAPKPASVGFPRFMGLGFRVEGLGYQHHFRGIVNPIHSQKKMMLG